MDPAADLFGRQSGRLLRTRAAAPRPHMRAGELPPTLDALAEPERRAPSYHRSSPPMGPWLRPPPAAWLAIDQAVRAELVRCRTS